MVITEPPSPPVRFRKRRLASVLLTLAAVCAAPVAPVAAETAKAGHHCPVRPGRVACVDLTHQTMWVQQGMSGHRIFHKVHIRTGMAGYRTRTGWFKIYWRHRHHVSSLYGTPMPYSQFFSGGQAFHGIPGSVYDPHGSYGCVNLVTADARRLWRVLHKGDRVYVWGRRSGT